MAYKKPTKKIDHIKVIDFDKEKMNEKIRNKMMEKTQPIAWRKLSSNYKKLHKLHLSLRYFPKPMMK